MKRLLRPTVWGLLALPILLIDLSMAEIPCPEMPDKITQINHDVRSDVDVGIGSLGKLKAGQLGVQTDVVAKNLFDKYPNTDRVIVVQMMAATYCGMLRDSTSLKDHEKIQLWSEFLDRVFKFENPDYKPAPAKPAQGQKANGKGAQSPAASPKPTSGNIVQGPGSVVSVNQQGGITAAQVNIGIPDRHLTPEQKDAIISGLQGNTCTISLVSYELGVSDALEYAFELKAALKAGGCIVPEDLTPAIRLKESDRGIFVQYYDPATHTPGEHIIIPNDTPQGMVFHALIKAQLPVMAAPSPNLPKDGVGVIVAAR
jgi:hypothetical protein